MALIQTRQVTVGTSAVRLDGTTEFTNLSQCLIRNVDATGNIWVGVSNATTANGFKIAPGEAVVVDLQRGEGIWGISDVASVAVHVMETGQ